MTDAHRIAVLWLVAINLWTVFRFWQDKRRARGDVRRTPESTLLGLAVLGGTPGAFAARALFRHKTRKQPFSSNLHAIALLQALALGGAGWFWLRGG